MGMKVALSDKIRSAQLMAINQSNLDIPSTNKLCKQLSNLKLLDRTLFITDDSLIHLASRNIPTIDSLSPEDVHVYDILRSKNLVVDIDALNLLQSKISLNAGDSVDVELTDSPRLVDNAHL